MNQRSKTPNKELGNLSTIPLLSTLENGMLCLKLSFLW